MWGVFYRPETVNLDQPGFKVPLSTALLSDPAFSSDPRTHPHFNAAFDAPHLPISTQPARTKPSQPRPETTRRGSMKALVRRLTSHHSLDRIDELDETDPFGANYHHNGPYEAIDGAHAQSTHTHTTIPRTNVRSKRAFNPRSLHPTRYQSPPRVPLIHGERGLSLHLRPGQILQHNTIYTSHVSSITSGPNQLSRQSNTPAVVAQPDCSRSRTLSNLQRNPPPHPLDDLRNQPMSPPRTPSQCYIGRSTTDILNIPPPYHQRDGVPDFPNQTTMTIFPPPRLESRLHHPDLLPPQPVSSPSVSPKTRVTEGAVLSHAARRKSVHSLDSSQTTNSTITRSTTRMQDGSLEPPRMRHLPKHLVMPTPLQPPPPQSQYRFPLVEHTIWRDEYPEPEYGKLEGADPKGRPVMLNHGPRLLRKKSSAIPGGLPIPHLVPTLQDDAAQEMGDTPTEMENDAERNKEKKRRRRLSKRKNDI